MSSSSNSSTSSSLPQSSPPPPIRPRAAPGSTSWEGLRGIPWKCPGTCSLGRTPGGGKCGGPWGCTGSKRPCCMKPGGPYPGGGCCIICGCGGPECGYPYPGEGWGGCGDGPICIGWRGGGGGPLIDLRILGRLTLLMNLCMTLEIRLYGESPPARGLLTHKWPFSGICG